MTIRRDLKVLLDEQKVYLLNGVAISYDRNDDKVSKKTYELENEYTQSLDEKIRIGNAAASMLTMGDVILIDSGTTTEQLAKQLPDDIPLTVVTYSMNSLLHIYSKKNITNIFSGGYYHSNIKMFESEEAVSLIERTCVNKAFISAGGVNNQLAVTTIAQFEVNVKRAAMDAAVEKILLITSDKFDNICPAKFATLTNFDTIITDNNLSDQWQSVIQENGITLRLV